MIELWEEVFSQSYPTLSLNKSAEVLIWYEKIGLFLSPGVVYRQVKY